MAARRSPLTMIPADYYREGSERIFTIPDGTDSGKAMFYQDIALGDKVPEKTVVFVHGNPENSYTYRHIVAELCTRANLNTRIVAMDHIGFGLSDQAGYEMTCVDHAQNLQFLVTHLDLNNVILVVHDWGGPIGLGAFTEEPRRLSGLVILNSTVFPIPKNGLDYNNYPISWLAWSKTPYLIPDKYWGAFAALAVNQQPASGWQILTRLVPKLLTIEKAAKSNRPRSAITVYRDQFQSGMNVKSSKRLVKESACWGEGYSFHTPGIGLRSTKSLYESIRKTLHQYWGNGEIKVRALAGKWDPLGQPAVLDQWIRHLPQLQGYVTLFEDAGHFVEESKPVEITEAILGLILGLD